MMMSSSTSDLSRRNSSSASSYPCIKSHTDQIPFDYTHLDRSNSVNDVLRVKEEENVMTLEDFLARASDELDVKFPIQMNKGKRGRVMMMDQAQAQRHKRMIKNRESAARSRERKQAYQVELESLVKKLEGENEELLKEILERSKERYNKLMEMLIPVEERPKTSVLSSRSLSRSHSLEW